MEQIVLSGFSDEIAPELDIQLAAIREWGLSHIELRAADGVNVSDFSPEKVKEVNKEVLKDAANRLLFDMKDEEYDTLLNEFGAIQHQLNLIGNIKGVDEVSPMTFPFDVTITYLREDEPETPLSQEDVLKNAHDVKDGQIKLPKVVG